MRKTSRIESARRSRSGRTGTSRRADASIWSARRCVTASALQIGRSRTRKAGLMPRRTEAGGVDRYTPLDVVGGLVVLLVSVEEAMVRELGGIGSGGEA